MLSVYRKKVLVTGGTGFLGRYVVEELRRKGSFVKCASSLKYDLTKQKDVERLFCHSNPSIVIHLAAAVGGIEANIANPGKYFYENIIMGAEVMEAARRHEVTKYVQVGTSCSYPAKAPTPVKETDLWQGPPNGSTGPYGVAKLALITMAKAYRRQYGLNAISLIPVNLFGPRDNFSPERSHVIPALVLKCLEAKKEGKPLVVWGTGQATREFLYVEEAAKAIVMATELYDKPQPINLGTGNEIFIKDLAKMVADAVGFTGDILFDHSKPDGQLRRCFDVSKAKEEFGFEATMPIEKGLKLTVEHYLNEQGITVNSEREAQESMAGCNT